MKLTQVPENQRKELCKMGQGEKCCSFLVINMDGFACGKGSDLEPILSQRRSLKQMRALGDNCSGPPTFTPNEVET